ncbi:hypothetical protein QCA50_001337 [Cerrena zonata]|uniref:Uncharacterized protein n=1 Tax=Cerrena zonata TaxID=2478898 RepID=A0AAW0GQG3_9APHY
MSFSCSGRTQHQCQPHNGWHSSLPSLLSISIRRQLLLSSVPSFFNPTTTLDSSPQVFAFFPDSFSIFIRNGTYRILNYNNGNDLLSMPDTSSATQDAQAHWTLIITVIASLALLGVVGLVFLIMFVVKKIRYIASISSVDVESQVSKKGFFMKVREFPKTLKSLFKAKEPSSPYPADIEAQDPKWADTYLKNNRHRSEIALHIPHVTLVSPTSSTPSTPSTSTCSTPTSSAPTTPQLSDTDTSMYSQPSVGTPIIRITCEDDVDGVVDESVIVIDEKFLSPYLPEWQADDYDEEEEEEEDWGTVSESEAKADSDLGAGGVKWVNVNGRWYF